MKKTLSGLTKLTRFYEFGYFVLITSLLGIAAAQGTLTARLVVVLLANWLAVSFAYMINDIEDAPDDAFSTKNSQRNPVSSGLISPKTARIAALLVGLIAAGLYAMLGLWTFIFGITCLFLGILYSLKAVRLKSMALMNIITRGLLLAGLPFFCGYFAFTSTLNRTWFWPFLFVISLSVFYDHRDEPRGVEGQWLSRVRQTAALFGGRSANTIVTAIIILVVTTGVVSFFLINLIPAWVMLTMSGMVILLILPPYLKTRRNETNESMQGLLISTLERAAAMALILQFVLPWLGRFFNSG